MTVISKSPENDITPDEDPGITAKRQAIKIREMEIDDLAVVFHLGETLFKSTEVPNLYRTWDPYEVTGMFNDDTEYCLVAEADHRIAGFALGTTITQSHSAWKYGYLIWLGVALEFQRMGMAEKLLHRFRDLESFGFQESGDTVRGLGTADMKGGCAALIEAFLAFHEQGGKDAAAALCLVVGEEESGDGARQLARNCHFPWAIIGEPTALVPCPGSYGYLEVQVETRGRRMHASMAGRRDNAIEALLQVMIRISRYMEHQRPEAVYNIRDLFSSRAGFAVPERCEAWLDLHLPPTAPIGDILMELEEVCIQKADAGADIQTLFRINTIDAGYALPDKGPVPAALRSACEHQGLTWGTAAFRSHSDANQLWSAGVKPLVLGPGQLEQAHTQEESVSCAQVRQAADLSLELLCRLFPV